LFKKSKQKKKPSGESDDQKKKAQGGKVKALKVGSKKTRSQPYQKHSKRGRRASTASYNPPSDSGNEEEGRPSSASSSFRGSRSPSASCPDLTYSDREADSPPSSPALLPALHDASEGLRDSQLHLDMLEPEHASDYASPSLPLVAKELLVDDPRTLFDDEIDDLRQRDGILSHGPSSAVQHAYGLEAAEEGAREVKAISGADPMWSVMWGVEDTPQETTSFVNGWWDYDEWMQDWGVVAKPDPIDIPGWY
jgi:hypothetical protein